MRNSSVDRSLSIVTNREALSEVVQVRAWFPVFFRHFLLLKSRVRSKKPGNYPTHHLYVHMEDICV